MTDLLEQSPFDPKAQRRIVIIADWIPPEFGAVGQYMQLRAQGLADRGHDVTLVGLSQTKASVVREQRSQGSLTEVRLHVRETPRNSMINRLLWTISINFRLLFAAFKALRAADGIMFTGSPPLLIHLLVPLKSLWRGRLVYRITDFYPECLIAARHRPSLTLRTLLWLTNQWRRRVDRFEVLGEDQMRRLRDGAHIPAERISLVRDGSPVEFAIDQPREPIPPDLAASCVLLYSGNYGIAHEVDTVVDGYRLHHQTGSGRVRLWLSATGAGAKQAADRLTALKLPFYQSRPVPLERLPGLLMAPDAHLVVLKDAFVGFVMPSKIYACLASQKPLIFVGSTDSDVNLLARASKVPYWQVSCGDSKGLAEALEGLADRTSARDPVELHG